MGLDGRQGRQHQHAARIDQVPRFEQVWTLDPAQSRAECRGQSVQMRPSLGLMGMPPDEAGDHPTRPPRFCGGNIDCKELVEGSTLHLPIAVEGALFSTGDGHARQDVKLPVRRLNARWNVPNSNSTCAPTCI
ncbi:MAG: acetamidase/formamidase family protein [Anaerolineae bacterium]